MVPTVALPRVVLLCDAAAATGLGHFVRCSALAARLSADGTAVHLLLPDDSLPQAVSSARAAGWDVTVGPWDHAEVVARTGRGGVAVVDSYRVDGRWLVDLHARTTAAGAHLAVIDDQADRAFAADLVLNQNLGAERFAYAGAGRVLAGPRYALLRPQFPAHRDAGLAGVDRLPERPARVLVLFGGTDASGMAVIAAEAAALAFPDAEIRAVVPAVVPAGHGTPAARVTYLPPTDAVHEEMLAADLVVSAGGTTIWELCCLARPTAVIAVAGNQQPAYDVLCERQAILPAGRAPVRDVTELAARLRRLTEPGGALRAVARRAAEVTDGLGCARVARALAELPSAGVRVRPAVLDDAALLHSWRNDPLVRSLSRSTDPISLDDHAAWLRSSLATSDRHLLIVESAGDATPAATTRYDLLPDGAGSRERWEVSITVAPEMRGRGLGRAALEASDAWLIAREPAASEIVAWVRRSNAGSLRLFERNCYRTISSADPDMTCLVRHPILPPVSRTP